MSHSIRSVRVSRRKRPSSSRSSVVSAPAGPPPASISACRTQLRSAVSVKSNSRATVPTGFPLSDPHGLCLELCRECPPLPFGQGSLLPHFRAIWSVHETGAGSVLGANRGSDMTDRRDREALAVGTQAVPDVHFSCVDAGTELKGTNCARMNANGQSFTIMEKR